MGKRAVLIGMLLFCAACGEPDTEDAAGPADELRTPTAVGEAFQPDFCRYAEGFYQLQVSQFRELWTGDKVDQELVDLTTLELTRILQYLRDRAPDELERTFDDAIHSIEDAMELVEDNGYKLTRAMRLAVLASPTDEQAAANQRVTEIVQEECGVEVRPFPAVLIDPVPTA